MASDHKIMGSRSLRRGEVTVEELRRLTECFDESEFLLDDAILQDVGTDDYDYLVVDGDLVVDGNFDPVNSGICLLIVTGNLMVNGVYRDFDAPASGVFVLGNMYARDVITRASLGVAGNLTVEQALIGEYNDYSAQILGDARARVFAPGNHVFDLRGDISFEIVIGADAHQCVEEERENEILQRIVAQPRDILVPSLVGNDPDRQHPVREIFLQRIWDRLPILRSDL